MKLFDPDKVAFGGMSNTDKSSEIALYALRIIDKILSTPGGDQMNASHLNALWHIVEASAYPVIKADSSVEVADPDREAEL